MKSLVQKSEIIGAGKGGHYERGLFTGGLGGISRIFKISKFSKLSLASPLLSTVWRKSRPYDLCDEIIYVTAPKMNCPKNKVLQSNSFGTDGNCGIGSIGQLQKDNPPPQARKFRPKRPLRHPNSP